MTDEDSDAGISGYATAKHAQVGLNGMPALGLVRRGMISR